MPSVDWLGDEGWTMEGCRDAGMGWLNARWGFEVCLMGMGMRMRRERERERERVDRWMAIGLFYT